MLTHWAMSSKSKPWTTKHEPCAPNLNRYLQFSTVSSNSEPWAPILNRELQLSTVSSNAEPWAPMLNPELHWSYSKIHKNLQIELSKTSSDNVQIHYSFYYILLYIICILFLLYIILYYMYFIFIICYFILYKLP